MDSLTAPLLAHHKQCDDLFANAEAAAHAGRWQECADAFRRFDAELEAHFATEENFLFPAFETATGMSAGPTQVMRMEHSQMRELLMEMADAQQEQDLRRFAGAGDTLLILMQQHNMKEENILYPMCDRSLDPATIDVTGRLRAQREGGACPE